MTILHAYKGRGVLTLGSTTLEVTTEVTLAIERDVAPIAYWAATGDVQGGIKEIAQRTRSIAVDMQLHDYSPNVLATALGATSAAGATGWRTLKLGMAATTGTVALAFAGYNKLSSASGSDWEFSLPKFRTEVIEELPLLGGKIAGYRLRGHSLRDTTATGAEFGTLSMATG